MVQVGNWVWCFWNLLNPNEGQKKLKSLGTGLEFIEENKEEKEKEGDGYTEARIGFFRLGVCRAYNKQGLDLILGSETWSKFTQKHPCAPARTRTNGPLSQQDLVEMHETVNWKGTLAKVRKGILYDLSPSFLFYSRWRALSSWSIMSVVAVAITTHSKKQNRKIMVHFSISMKIGPKVTTKTFIGNSFNRIYWYGHNQQQGVHNMQSLGWLLCYSV